MAPLQDWAGRWLAQLVRDGGAHGPGSKRTIAISDDSFSYSYDAEADLDALYNARRTGASGRAAVTYERAHAGGPSLWIDGVRFEDGAIVEAVRLVLPYKKSLLGKTSPRGPVVDLSAELGR